MLEVMIVDDEPIAIRRVAALLRDVDDVAVVATAGNAASAIELAARHRPDLVLLDIEMPGLDGIGLAARLRAGEDPPDIVFVTAFGRFALDAYGLDAADYLVKPVEPERLRAALDRVRRARAGHEAHARVTELEDVVRRLRAVERDDVDATLWLPHGRGDSRVPIRDILWMAAERDYVRVHVAERSHLVRGRIGEFADRLAAHGFVRVHRSTLVRVAAVARVEYRGDRSYRLVLANGAAIDAGRRFAAVVRTRIRQA